MAGRREGETEYSEEVKSIEEIRTLRKEKEEARKKAERKTKSREVLFSLIFVGICVGAVLGLSALLKRPSGNTPETSAAVSETLEATVSAETSGNATEPVPSETEAAEESVTAEETTAESETAAETTTTAAPETTEETTTAAPETTVYNPNVQGDIYIPSWVTQDFLTISPYNRSGEQLPEVKNIVIHYVGNPGSTAKNNRDYFEDLARTQERAASSHFVVGLEGEILQCIPLWEVAYANYPRNYDTISIEVCHPDATGQFNSVTYASVVKLAACLLEQYGLTSEDLIRHYDCNGKYCPLYYVEHPEAWQQLKNDVADYMEAHPDIRHEDP